MKSRGKDGMRKKSAGAYPPLVIIFFFFDFEDFLFVVLLPLLFLLQVLLWAVVLITATYWVGGQLINQSFIQMARSYSIQSYLHKNDNRNRTPSKNNNSNNTPHNHYTHTHLHTTYNCHHVHNKLTSHQSYSFRHIPRSLSLEKKQTQISLQSHKFLWFKFLSCCFMQNPWTLEDSLSVPTWNKPFCQLGCQLIVSGDLPSRLQLNPKFLAHLPPSNR